jgi:regulatory protein
MVQPVSEAQAEIQRLEPVPRSRNRLRLILDRGDPIEVSLEVATRLELYAGVLLDPATRRRIGDAQQKWAVRQAALHLLSYRPRSEHELRTRLRKKEHAPGIVEWCIHAFRTEGLLNDLAFSMAFTRTRILLKPRGRRRLVQELRKKGVRGEVAQEAVDRAFTETDTSEQALTLESALSWVNKQPPAIRDGLSAAYGTPERERARRRLLGYLKRRGFPADAIRRAVDEAQRADTYQAIP